MKSMTKWFAIFVCIFFMQSCAVYAVYGVYRTIRDINTLLVTVNGSITNIRTILDEGKDLKRAAEDGKLISVLAEKIPTLIKNQVEKETKVKIDTLSGDLKGAALALVKGAAAENLNEAVGAYNTMVNTYNQLNDLTNDMTPI
jgi:hypothetical protein